MSESNGPAVRPFTVDLIKELLVTVAPSPDVDHMKVMLHYGQSVNVLALTLDGEGRGEHIAGRAGIAWTAINRIGRYGKTITDVCLRRLQYSCWWPEGGLDNYARQMRMAEWALTKTVDMPSDVIRRRFRESQFLAAAVLQDQILDLTNGATHYMTTELWHRDPPKWARTAKVNVVIGNHVFFSGVD